MLSLQSSQPKNQSVSSFIVNPAFQGSPESADAESPRVANVRAFPATA
jgi:hypothetical protein